MTDRDPPNPNAERNRTNDARSRDIDAKDAPTAMDDKGDAELRALLEPTLDASAAVPAGFSDRLLARLDEETPSAKSSTADRATESDASTSVAPRKRASFFATAQTAALGALAAAAAIFLFQAGTDVDAEASSASSVALAPQETVQIGNRGLAVGESDAQVAWNVAADGSAVVEQTRGRVFYRVDKSSTSSPKPFVVRTPFGEAHVRGTCFAVEVNPMTTTQQLSLWNKGKLAVAGAAAGALLTGTILVTVYEGRVDVKSAADREGLSLKAGETALASADQAPTKVAPTLASLQKERAFLEDQRKELRDQVTQLEEQLKVVMIAKANGKDPVVAENTALKEELAQVRSKLSAYEEVDADRRGEPTEWPEDIDPIYKEAHMKEALLSTLKDLGLKGDLDSVDCTEFPCMAFGVVEVDGDREASAREMERFSELLKGHFPQEGVSRSNSVWSRSIKKDDGSIMHQNNFGVSIYPDGFVEGEEKKALEKRNRFRMQSYSDSLVAD